MKEKGCGKGFDSVEARMRKIRKICGNTKLCPSCSQNHSPEPAATLLKDTELGVSQVAPNSPFKLSGKIFCVDTQRGGKKSIYKILEEAKKRNVNPPKYLRKGHDTRARLYVKDLKTFIQLRNELDKLLYAKIITSDEHYERTKNLAGDLA